MSPEKPSDRMFQEPPVEELHGDWSAPASTNGTHPKPPPIDQPLLPLSSFIVPQKGDSSILLGDRYLSRGDGGILSGPSGIGKSSLSMQLAILWGLGMPAVEVVPNGPLRSLIIQSEDSDGDIAEVWSSMCQGIGISSDQISVLDDRVRIVNERIARGHTFYGVLERAIKAHKPDLVWVNPLQAFMDGDVTDSQQIGRFLREHLNKLNTPAQFAYFLVHHTTKPATGQSKHERLWHEVMYDMAGGAELINWARAIMSLRPSTNEGEFNLVLAKRGRRAGVTRQVETGAGFRLETVTTIPLKHSALKLDSGAPMIFWEPRAPDAKPDPDAKKKGGAPTKYNFSEFKSSFPSKDEQPIRLAELHRRVAQNIPLKPNALYNLVQRFVKEGCVEEFDRKGETKTYRLPV